MSFSHIRTRRDFQISFPLTENERTRRGRHEAIERARETTTCSFINAALFVFIFSAVESFFLLPVNESGQTPGRKGPSVSLGVSQSALTPALGAVAFL